MSSTGNTVSAGRGHAEEQEICLCCGMCCDGTLFINAGLKQNERGGLPAWIEENSFTTGDEDFFRLPCGYFSGRCTIYDSKKAFVCSAYRCRVLKDFTNGKISKEEAVDTVRFALKMRDDLIGSFREMTGRMERIHFRKMLSETGRLQAEDPKRLISADGFELLVARCNIFVALLIKHFMKDEDFDRLVMK